MATGSTHNDARGTLDEALAQANRLLREAPELALEQTQEILAVVPDEPRTRLIKAKALRALGRQDDAAAALTQLAAQFPLWAAPVLERGRLLAAQGKAEDAVACLRRAVALDPERASAWTALGNLLELTGDHAGAQAAHSQSLTAALKNPQLLEAAALLNEGKLAPAESLLRDYLKRSPNDVAAIRMLAELGTRLSRYEDAEHLLSRALELTPDFAPARYNLALVLHRRNRSAEALAHLEQLLAEEPNNPGYLSLKAAALSHVGEYAGAADLYERLLGDFPNQPKVWMSYGHALKTLGRRAACEAAYLRAIAQAPTFGEVWWSLANLKTFAFTPEQIAAMRAALDTGEQLPPEDRFHLAFALGKALEDAGDSAQAFACYAQANAWRREQLDYRADETTRHLQRSAATFTPAFFAARTGWGHDAPDPIFIVGLPRAGSTLIEQILASHSAEEGTHELPDVIALATRLGGRKRAHDPTRYPEMLAELSPEDFAALGREYLERTRVQRKTDKPRFIDKMPNNFQHVGLIHLMLPNAIIVDARRHPLGCCFSGFKQHFARGQAFTYSLEDIGHYYRDYVDLMAHFDAVLPGRVHRVYYERMIENFEMEVRALLDACRLPFEPGCLRFFENERAVRTASSEQVRRPIYSDGVDQWRAFEPYLDPLKAALGPALTGYPV